MARRCVLAGLLFERREIKLVYDEFVVLIKLKIGLTRIDALNKNKNTFSYCLFPSPLAMHV